MLKNIYKYIDWLNSCKLIVSNDSLGLHLGLALKKKVVGLFGPTSEKEVYFYKRGEAIVPEKDLKCRSCFEANCLKYDNSCIDLISPEQVYDSIKQLLI